MEIIQLSSTSCTCTVAENRLSQQHERFLPRESNFKFVTECFFITQRALHVGLLPAVETFSNTASDLGKQIQAKVGAEKLLKDLNAVSEGNLSLFSEHSNSHSSFTPHPLTPCHSTFY